MSEKDGGPAFPVAENVTGGSGISLRDYFAAKAMYVPADKEPDNFRAMAKVAWAMADAMIAERSK